MTQILFFALREIKSENKKYKTFSLSFHEFNIRIVNGNVTGQTLSFHFPSLLFIKINLFMN